MSGGCGPNTIVLDGLVIYVDAGNIRSYTGSGTTCYDLTPNRENGTLINGPTYSSSNGGFFTFDGINDYIDFGSDIQIKNGGLFTQETWFKTDVVTGGPYNFCGYTSPNTVSWYWSIYNSKLAIWNKWPGIWKYGGTTLSTGTWYQAVLVSDAWNGTSYKVYLNGVNDGGDIESYTFNGSSEYKKFYVRDIGRSSTTYSRYFDGVIASSKFYDKALSAAEVLQNFEVHKARFGV